jgi:hypothetical protein
METVKQFEYRNEPVRITRTKDDLYRAFIGEAKEVDYGEGYGGVQTDYGIWVFSRGRKKEFEFLSENKAVKNAKRFIDELCEVAERETKLRAEMADQLSAI